MPRNTAARRSSLRLPTHFQPQLAVLTATPPTRGEWLFEIKFDGCRMLTRIEKGEARLITRRGHDRTDRMPELANKLGQFGIDGAWLDGEIVVYTAEGGTDFNAVNAFDRRHGVPIAALVRGDERRSCCRRPAWSSLRRFGWRCQRRSDAERPSYRHWS